MTENRVIRRVGAFYLVRGRHDDGFIRLDALNYSQADALAQRERLLPNIRDEEVRAMAEMMGANDA